MSKRILLFIRFFKKEHYREMFINGDIYMNRLRYFKEYEDETLGNVGDKHEAVSHWFQPNDVTISIEDPASGKMVEINGIVSPIPVQYSEFDEYHVYCLYAVYFDEEEKIESLDDMKTKILPNIRAKDLGDYCAIIEPAQFLQRLDKALMAVESNSGRGIVEYFDASSFHGSFQGDEAIMRKKDDFAHQREYRIFSYDGVPGTDSLTLSIGDLSDIVLSCHKDDLENIITLGEEAKSN